MSKEQYLKDVQQQLYRLLNVYSELKRILESAAVINEHPPFLQELEPMLADIQNEITRLYNTLQPLKSKPE